MSDDRVLEVGLPGLPSSIDTAHVRTLVEWTILYNCLDPLIGGGLTADVQAGLASRWKISQKKQQIIFSLASDRKFSDGTPIRPGDVKATLEYHLKKNGSSKLKLRGKLESVEVNGGDVVLTFHEGHLPDPIAFAVADFGILPAQLLSREGKKGPLSYSVTSGKYYISSISSDRIELTPNRFHPQPPSAKVIVFELGSKPAFAWLRERPDRRVLRVPEWEPFLDIPGARTALSSPFWVRLGFFSKRGQEKLNLAERRYVRDVVRGVVQEVTGSKLEKELFPPFVAKASSLATTAGKVPVRLKLVLNSFSFTQQQQASVDAKLKVKLNVQVEWLRTPSDWFDRISTKDFDMGLAQITFGAADPLPSVEYMVQGYLAGAISDDARLLMDGLRKPISRADRVNLFNRLEDEFESSAILFGLGAASARFVFPSSFSVQPSSLLSGELDFSVFRPGQ